MPRVGFEPTIPAFERAEAVHALDLAATVIGGFRGIRRVLSISLCEVCLIIFRNTAVVPSYSVLSCDAKVLRELILHARNSAACFEDLENS
jgi:hypothetical protein